MKTNKIIPAFTALALFAASPAFAVDSHAKGDTKKNGTHAASHKTKAHNHSAKGKTHTHTGSKGAVDPSKKK